MIFRRVGAPEEKVYTCPTDIARGIMACQRERLFVDLDRVLRLFGPQIYAVFTSFSNGEINEALREAETLKSSLVVFKIVSELPATPAMTEQKVAAKILEVSR